MQNFASFRNKLSSAVSNIQDSARSAVAQDRAAARNRQETTSSQQQQNQQQQEYLRLPIASAKKLTWYDKGDIVQIVKQHLREKQEILDTNWALKRTLLRKGVGEKELEQEVQLMLEEVESIKKNDTAVNNTLLISTQTKLDSLLQQNKQQEAYLQQQTSRMQELQDIVDLMKLVKVEFKYNNNIDNNNNNNSEKPIQINFAIQQNSFDGQSTSATTIPEDHFLIPVDVVQQVSQSLNTFLQSETKQKNLIQWIQIQEQLLDCAEREDLMKLIQDKYPEDEQMSALMSKLQRLEGERKLHIEQMGELQQQIFMLNERDASLQAMTEKLQQVQQEKMTLKETIQKLEINLQDEGKKKKHVELVAERKLAELRAKVGASAQHHGDMFRRAQEVALDSERRAEEADKKATRSEARAARLDEELQQLKQSSKKLEKQVKDLERQREELSARATQAEAAADDAKLRTFDGEEMRQAIKKVEEKFEDRIREADNLSQQFKDERDDMVSRVNHLNQVQKRLENRILESERREIKLQAEVQVAEGIIQERDELQVRNRVLEDKLEEYKSKNQQTEDYRQVANQLESGRLQAEQELLTTAKMVTVLEEKLREVQQTSRSAQLRAQEAEHKVQVIEADVDKRVRQLVEESGSNPQMWPSGAQLEINRLQTKADTLQGLISSLQGQLEMETSQLNEQLSLKEALNKKISTVEQRAAVREEQALQMVVEVERKLSVAENQLKDYRKHIDLLQEENDKLVMAKSLSRHSAGSLRGGGSILQNGDAYQDGLGQHKIGGVDIIYLRNVLFKFLAALSVGRQSERDALLPVIATLVQANPQEFRELKKSVQELNNTQSMLSVLGSRSNSR